MLLERNCELAVAAKLPYRARSRALPAARTDFSGGLDGTGGGLKVVTGKAEHLAVTTDIEKIKAPRWPGALK